MTARRAVERCGLVVRPADEGEQAAVSGIDRDQGRLETWKPKTPQSVADGDFGRILNFLDERRVNFAEIAGAFLANGAAVQVRTARELEDVVVELMADPVRRARLGAAARALVDANRGAKDTTLKVLADLVPPRQTSAVVRPFRVIH